MLSRGHAGYATNFDDVATMYRRSLSSHGELAGKEPPWQATGWWRSSGLSTTQTRQFAFISLHVTTGVGLSGVWGHFVAETNLGGEVSCLVSLGGTA